MNWALLLGLVAAYTWYIRGGGVAPGAGRIASYRRWMRRAPMAFGGSALLALVIAGRIENLWLLPAEFVALAVEAQHFAGFGGNMATFKIAVLAGFGGGAVLGLLISRWQVRRGQRPFTAGDIERILPQRGGEFGWTAALGIAAGIVEELFFRLALPLFAAVVTGDALPGFALATLLFAAAHRYQGWAGMGFSGIAGTLLAILYLATGELWFAMLVHALLNLNGLVLRPAVLQRPGD